MHEVLVNRLEGLSLPRKNVVRLTDRPDMTLDVYRGRKTTMQQQQQQVSSTCNVYFLNSTYSIFSQFKRNKFSRLFCCWVYYSGELSGISFGCNSAAC